MQTLNVKEDWQARIIEENFGSTQTIRYITKLHDPNKKKKRLPVPNILSEIVGTKFQLKLKILILLTKFAQKRYFWSKTEKVNITIEFCIFELVWIPNLSLD